MLFFDHTAKLSGGERSLLLILEKLDRTRFYPFLVTPELGILQEKASVLGIESEIIHIPGFILSRKRSRTGMFFLFLSFAASLAVIFRLTCFVKRKSIDVIYTNSQKAHLYGLIAGFLSDIPVVWHFRDILNPGIAHSIVRILGNHLVSRIIAISKAVAEQFETLGRTSSRIEVIYNAIDIDDFIRAAKRSKTDLRKEFKLLKNSRIVASIGQIARWKGQENLIYAAKELSPKFPNLYFFIIGKSLFKEDRYEEQIKELVKELGLEARCVFTGYRWDIPGIMSDLDILLHTPQEPEPFGRVLIESMAAGTPVVAFNMGATKEILHDNMAMLVPPFDRDKIVKNISKLLENDKLYQEIARSAQEYVKEKFDFPRLLESVENILKQTRSAVK